MLWSSILALAAAPLPEGKPGWKHARFCCLQQVLCVEKINPTVPNTRDRSHTALPPVLSRLPSPSAHPAPLPSISASPTHSCLAELLPISPGGSLCEQRPRKHDAADSLRASSQTEGTTSEGGTRQGLELEEDV